MKSIMRIVLGIIDTVELLIISTPNGEDKNKFAELRQDLYDLLNKYIK